LVPHKRVDFIIKAIAALKDPMVNLFIIGNGYERSNLEKLTESLSLTSQVFFFGRVSDEALPSFYNASDAFVTASLHEGVCVPIMESYSAGKPAIVPNNTAMVETAGNGGLTFKENSIDDLAEKIRILKIDKCLRFNLQKNALEIASKRSFESVFKDYERLVREIMNTQTYKKGIFDRV
jgi:glycosyltransferase involved in cell wall biosynthesis